MTCISRQKTDRELLATLRLTDAELLPDLFQATWNMFYQGLIIIYPKSIISADNIFHVRVLNYLVKIAHDNHGSHPFPQSIIFSGPRKNSKCYVTCMWQFMITGTLGKGNPLVSLEAGHTVTTAACEVPCNLPRQTNGWNENPHPEYAYLSYQIFEISSLRAICYYGNWQHLLETAMPCWFPFIMTFITSGLVVFQFHCQGYKIWQCQQKTKFILSSTTFPAQRWDNLWTIR